VSQWTDLLAAEPSYSELLVLLGRVRRLALHVGLHDDEGDRCEEHQETQHE
jgi:hypothetical protein